MREAPCSRRFVPRQLKPLETIPHINTALGAPSHENKTPNLYITKTPSKEMVIQGCVPFCDISRLQRLHVCMPLAGASWPFFIYWHGGLCPINKHQSTLLTFRAGISAWYRTKLSYCTRIYRGSSGMAPFTKITMGLNRTEGYIPDELISYYIGGYRRLHPKRSTVNHTSKYVFMSGATSQE